MDASDFPLPLDIFRYSIVPKTRLREVCFLRSTCQVLRTAIFLPKVVLGPNELEKTPNQVLKHVLQLSETLDAVEFSATSLCDLARQLQENTTIKHIRADKTSGVIYSFLMDYDPSPKDREAEGLLVGQAFARVFQLPNKIALLDLSNTILGPAGTALLVNSLIESKNSSLKTLCLSRAGLKLDGCKAVAQLIEESRSLTSLDLSCNIMDVSCAETLGPALSHTTSLTHLDLGWCFEKGPAAPALLSSLKQNNSLKSLSIEHSFYGSETGKAITNLLAMNTTLTSLNGSHSPHKDVNVTLTLSAIHLGLCQSSTLKELILRDCYLEDPCAFALAESIKSSRSLLKLDLGGEKPHSLSGGFVYLNHFSAQGIRGLLWALAKNKSIQHFILSSFSSWEGRSEVGNVNVSDEIGQLLNENQTLKTFDLRGGRLKLDPLSTMFDALKANKTLLSLTLCDLQITKNEIPSFVAALQVNTTLQELSLARNSLIGPEGATAFASYLEQQSPAASALAVLDLSACGVTDVGAIALAKALANNYSLQSLNLSHNDKIRNQSAQAFAQLLRDHQRLQVLDLRNCSIASTGLKSIMQVCDATKSISFLGLTGNLSGAMKYSPESVAAYDEDKVSRRVPIDLRTWEDEDDWGGLFG